MELDPKTQAVLHEKLGKALMEMLEGQPCDHCGRSYPGAKELTVIRQWLADNGTTADLRNQAPIHAITDDLPTFGDPEARVERPGKKSKKKTA